MKPGGEIPQFGDNDNGRLLKIWPEHQMMHTREAIQLNNNLVGYDELALDAVTPMKTS